MTKVAPPAVARVLPTAIARAAPTALVPAWGEIIAVGTVVVTLIEFGVLKPEDVLTSGQVRSSTISGGVAGAAGGAAVGGAIGAAATPSPASTTTAAPALEPRKYPNQTCEMPELTILADQSLRDRSMLLRCSCAMALGSKGGT